MTDLCDMDGANMAVSEDACNLCPNLAWDDSLAEPSCQALNCDAANLNEKQCNACDKSAWDATNSVCITGEHYGIRYKHWNGNIKLFIGMESHKS